MSDEIEGAGLEEPGIERAATVREGRGRPAPAGPGAEGAPARGAARAADDPLVAALVAADPARDVTVDLVSLRARVDAVVAREEQGAGGSAADVPTAGVSTADAPPVGTSVEVPAGDPRLGDATAPAATAPVVDLAADRVVTRSAVRSRRSVRLMGVAAAVVGAVVVAGVSYSFGVTRGPWGDERVLVGDAGSAGTTVDPVVIPRASRNDNQRVTAGAETLAAGAAGGSAADSAGGAAYSSSAADGMGAGGASSGTAESSYVRGWEQNRFQFHDGGLSSVAGEAEGWTLDATAVYSKKSVTALADALGVEGTPTNEWGTWSVGPTTGEGTSLSVYTDGSVSLYDPDADVTSGKAPSTKKAVARATALLTTLGLDPADYTFEVEADTMAVADDSAGGTVNPYTWVTAYQLMGGKSSGLSWSFTVTKDGISSAYGSLAATVPLGQYEIVSPAQAFARLTDSRFSGSVWPSTYPTSVQRTWDTAATQSPEASGGPTVPPVVEAGHRLDWAVADVTISDARLGLSTYYETDGAVLVLPTYELRTSDGGSWAVIAVADDELAL